MLRLLLFFISLTCISHRVVGQTEAELLVAFDSLFKAGNTPMSIETGEKWKAKVLEHGVQDTLKFVSRLIRIADGYRYVGQSKKGLETLRPGFDLQRTNAPYYPDLLKMYGFILQSNAEYQRADSCFQLSKTAYQRAGLEGSNRFITLLCSQADNEYAQSHVEQAITLYEDILQRRAENQLPEDLSLGAVFHSLSMCHQDLGNVSLACDYTAKSIETYARFLPPTNPSLLNSKLMYATLMVQAGQLAKAEPVALEVLQLMGEGEYRESIYYAAALENLASLRGLLGQDDSALQLLQQAGKLFTRFLSENDPANIQNKLNQARFMLSLGRKQEARDLILALKQSLEKSEKPDQSSLSETLSLLAKCSEKPEEAIEIGIEACKICREVSGKTNCGKLNDIPLALAFRYLQAGNYAKCAETLALSEPDESSKFPKRKENLEWLQYHAQLEFAQNHWAEAQQYFERFLSIRMDMASDELFLTNEVQWLDQSRFFRSAADLMFTMLQKSAVVEPDYYTICLDFQLFTKSMELSAARKIRESIQQDSNLSTVFNAWLNIRERLGWAYLQPREVLDQRQIDPALLAQKADSLEKILTQKSAAYAAANMRQTPGWRGVSQHLKPGEAAIEIAYYHDLMLDQTDSAHYVVFILKPGGAQPQVFYLPDADRFDQILLEKYLAECSVPDGKGQTGALYTAFWQKLEPYLKGVSRLFVSADGAFFKLNLDAIQLPDGQYVADRYELRRIFSLYDIAREKTTDTTPGLGNKTVFLAGNPMFLLASDQKDQASIMRSVLETPDTTQLFEQFGSSPSNASDLRGLELKPLPESEKEVNSIADMLRKKGFNTAVVTGVNATESSVKSLQNPSILHLATHGYFLANTRSTATGLTKAVAENNPMLRSMLFFSGAQNTLDKKPLGAEDGIMTAYEAQNLNLKGTELVVLSACKSAQGKVQNGAGVYGLQRALRIAGAQSVLLSLWDVDDKAGREFMVAFYGNWLNGMSKYDAFRKAQLDIKRKYPQPFYWAGFVLMGE